MINPNFIKAWRAWVRHPIPITNFRNGYRSAPTYELEHDIDHSVSYVHGLVQDLIAGKELDYKTLASKELSALEQMVAKLNRCQVNEPEKEKFRKYISDMTFILRDVSENCPQ